MTAPTIERKKQKRREHRARRAHRARKAERDELRKDQAVAAAGARRVLVQDASGHNTLSTSAGWWFRYKKRELDGPDARPEAERHARAWSRWHKMRTGALGFVCGAMPPNKRALEREARMPDRGVVCRACAAHGDEKR